MPLVPGPAQGPDAVPAGVDAWAEANARVWGVGQPQAQAVRHEVRPDEPASAAELPWEEAWLLAGRLRADGIPAVVYPDYTRASYRSSRRFQVIVRADRLSEAKESMGRHAG